MYVTKKFLYLTIHCYDISKPSFTIKNQQGNKKTPCKCGYPVVHYRTTFKYCYFNKNRQSTSEQRTSTKAVEHEESLENKRRDKFSINIGLRSMVDNEQLLQGIDDAVERISLIRWEAMKLAYLYVTMNADNIADMMDRKPDPLDSEFYMHCIQAVSVIPGHAPVIRPYLQPAYEEYCRIRGHNQWTSRSHITQSLQHISNDIAKNTAVNIFYHFKTRLKRHIALQISAIPAIMESMSHHNIQKIANAMVETFWVSDDDDVNMDWDTLKSSNDLWEKIGSTKLTVSQQQQ